MRIVGSVAGVEKSVLSVGAFSRTARIGPVTRLAFSWLIKEFDGKGVPLCVLKVTIKKSFG